jgi:hypothetical protein
MAGNHCLKPWGTDPYTVGTCIGTTVTDPLGNANPTLAYYERMLMWKYGCSAPVNWESWDPGTQDHFIRDKSTIAPNQTVDQADAVMMLCPIGDGEAQAYVNSIGQLPNADHAARNSMAFCDGNMMTPNDGYFWAVPWVDPTCTMTAGCMTSAPQ